MQPLKRTIDPYVGQMVILGLVSLCVDEAEVQERALAVAAQLAAGAQSAIRWTKQTLNNWYRAQAAVLDASLAYEFYGFGSATRPVVPSPGRHRRRVRTIWPRVAPGGRGER